MYNLINNNFNRTYNPSGRQNALSDIKRMLTARDTAAQHKACGYLIEVVNRYNKNSEEGARMVEYLITNDITVFLCEATSNLDFLLYRSILTCLRILWRSTRFFTEEHAAHSMTAVLRALAHYAGSGPVAAIDTCLHYICDLLNGITTNETTSALCYQSAYSAIQLLSCLNSLISQTNRNPNIILSSALVLDALISYQPPNLTVKAETANALVEVVRKWFDLLTGALNHAVLVGENGSGMFYVVACQLGIDVLRLTKLLYHGETNTNFVQSIITDDQEVKLLKQSALDMSGAVQKVISDLVLFTKEHQTEINTEEYRVFLKFLLYFFYESTTSEALPNFCDMLFSTGYLTMLPQAQIMRKDISIRKASTLVLKELLKVLADKYLNVPHTDNASANDIQMGLVELQYGIEKPQSIGMQLQKEQPYSLLIYIYFYSQSTDNPEEATASLLPYLVDHILKMSKSFKPPPYIIKALWLVFAMSTLSNDSFQSLEERVYLEKATDRLISLLYPEPSVYYTHNPAILLWAFTSLRISENVRFHVLSQWLKHEDCLPIALTSKPLVWQLLLNIIVQSTDKDIVGNSMAALYLCLDEGEDEMKQQFTGYVWSMLPNFLSKSLIDCDSSLDTNITYLLEIATSLVPLQIDQSVCLKTAVLITAIFTKNHANIETSDIRTHYDCVCLKLCLYLLGLANDENDNRVLLTFINRAGFLSSVLYATNSSNDKLACAALQLLSYIVHYFTKNNYKPKSILQIQTHLVIQSLRSDSHSERGASLLQLVYTVLNGRNTPVVLAYDIEETPALQQQCNALRALMFRVQLMMCCRESETQSSAGWKTLSSIFKHAILSKNDSNLVATLTSQPWTHILVQFQLTQPVTPEFLSFLHNWLTLLNVTVKNGQERMKMNMNKHSLVIRTMCLLKSLTAEDGKEMAQKILMVVKGILDNAGVKY